MEPLCIKICWAKKKVCLAKKGYQPKCGVMLVVLGWFPAIICLFFAKQSFLLNSFMRIMPRSWNWSPLSGLTQGLQLTSKQNKERGRKENPQNTKLSSNWGGAVHCTGFSSFKQFTPHFFFSFQIELWSAKRDKNNLLVSGLLAIFVQLERVSVNFTVNCRWGNKKLTYFELLRITIQS